MGADNGTPGRFAVRRGGRGGPALPCYAASTAGHTHTHMHNLHTHLDPSLTPLARLVGCSHIQPLQHEAWGGGEHMRRGRGGRGHVTPGGGGSGT